MTAPPLEMHFSIWSANRDFRREDSNCFTVDLKSRYNIRAAALTTAELPMTQYTVEAAWNSFFYDLGWSFEHAGEGFPSVDVLMPGYGATRVALPRCVSSCTLEPLTGNGELTWRVHGGHGLSLPHLQYLNVVVHCVTQENSFLNLKVQDLGPGNDVVVTASSSALREGVKGVLVVGTGFSLVLGPDQLARVLEDALTSKLPTRYGRIVCEIRSNSTGTEEWSVSTSSSVQMELRPAGSCRADIAGTLPYSRPLMQLTSTSSKLLNLSAGNYDLGSLRSALEGVLDPLSLWKRPFDARSLGLAFDNGVIAWCGEFGGDPSCCHPEGIASRLVFSPEMVQSTGRISVSYHSDRFTIYVQPLTVDGLRSAAKLLQAVGPVASLMGFASEPQWCPLIDGSYQLKGAQRPVPFPEAQIRLPISDNDGYSIVTQRKLRISAAPRSTIDTLFIRTKGFRDRYLYVLSSTRTGEISPNYGVAPGSLLVVPLEATSVFGQVREILFRDQGQDRAMLAFYPLDAQVPDLDQTPAFLVSIPVELPQNLFIYPAPSSQWPRLSEVLGFPPGRSAGSLLQAPFIVNLDHPAFVLVEVSLGHCSVNLVHWVQNDFRSNLFAKLPAYCHTRWERSGLVQKIGSGLTTVQHFQIRLLNPWLQPYATHGYNWSCTLLLVLGDLAVQLS